MWSSNRTWALPDVPAPTISKHHKSYSVPCQSSIRPAAPTLPHPTQTTQVDWILHNAPDDILYEILSQCCLSVQDVLIGDLAPYSLNTHREPWNLTHVCRRWRHMLLRMPHPWAVLYLNFSRHTQTQAIAELLELQLVRSRDVPLTLRMYVNPYNVDATSPCHPFQRALSLDVLRRVVNLRFNFLPPPLQVPGVFSNLAALHVTTVHGASQLSTAVLGELPSLKWLATDQPSALHEIPPSVTAFTTTTTCFTLPNLFTLLQRMQDLTYLDVSFGGSGVKGGMMDIETESMTLRQLRTLVVTDLKGVGDTKALLTSVDMPRLQGIHLVFGTRCSVDLPTARDMKPLGVSTARIVAKGERPRGHENTGVTGFSGVVPLSALKWEVGDTNVHNPTLA
ncbi:hypothetical protein CYLTODRAFT_451478 [Cylindrobasidium torrendii FP15055 ss-10]|uniref:F-box domain-containing protein n=1 Tax=Cylindrobasidium torrendii FP15055 ss-10 TaxID=1314674 RepID=A0A0D7BKJ1_9AGAR|nr:hypothetical protein CYLTODRAFT_451478 [Cylindrobasidium torrendii FP15055 ss-10]